jgi:hypothetical protein
LSVRNRRQGNPQIPFDKLKHSIFEVLISGFSLQHAESWQNASSGINSSEFGKEPCYVVESCYYIACFAKEDQALQGCKLAYQLCILVQYSVVSIYTMSSISIEQLRYF